MLRVGVQLGHVAQPGAAPDHPFVAHTGVRQLQAVPWLLAVGGSKGDVVWRVPILCEDHLQQQFKHSTSRRQAAGVPHSPAECIELTFIQQAAHAPHSVLQNLQRAELSTEFAPTLSKPPCCRSPLMAYSTGRTSPDTATGPPGRKQPCQTAGHGTSHVQHSALARQTHAKRSQQRSKGGGLCCMCVSATAGGCPLHTHTPGCLQPPTRS